MPEGVRIDATTFQKPISDLAETISQKVRREAPKLLRAPTFVSEDLHVLTRQAQYTYAFLFYLNADERRDAEWFWKNAYSIVTLPLVRNMIDCLFNATLILQDPVRNGVEFRKSGFRRLLNSLQEDENKYRGKSGWDSWLDKTNDMWDLQVRASGFKVNEVLASPNTWPTLGRYVLQKKKGVPLTPHQEFIKTFTYGQWREYSAMAHGAFEGLAMVAMYYIPDIATPDFRERMDELYPNIMGMHLGRAALVLLSLVTEFQIYFKFDGGSINSRIHQCWRALLPLPEGKELWDERYKILLPSKGIRDEPEIPIP